MTVLNLELFYGLSGAVLAALAGLIAVDRSHPHRWGSALFWGGLAVAIGAGKLFGRGLHQGTQTQNSFVPEQHTDFIFAAVGEELGFIGSALVLMLFLAICFRLLVIAQNAKDDFGSLIAIGVFSMILFQTVINIGMTIGLSPVTGIPLPFLSYGRSALLMNCLAIGIVESVANYRRRTRF